MAIEATNNNNSVNPLYTTAAGTAIGGAGSFFGTKAILDSSVKKAMESADSFSKSKKAQQVVSTLASETKSKLEAAQGEFAVQAKELPDGIDPTNARNFLQRLETLKKTADIINIENFINEFLKDKGYTNIYELGTKVERAPEREALRNIDRSILARFSEYDLEEALEKATKEGDKRTLDFLDLVARFREIPSEYINNTDTAGIEALREAAKGGNQQASDFLDLVAKLSAINPADENIQDLIKQEVKSSTCIQRLQVEAINISRRLRDEGHRTIEDLEYAVQNSSERKLLEETMKMVDTTQEAIQEAKKILPAYEKIKPAAQAVADMEAASEALENASKTSDAAVIKSNLEGHWDNIKASAESIYKNLNKNTIRMAGILGALGLGVAGYLVAKSQNPEK